MYEEIDLDGIESNKDEAPDYRPMLKSSSGLGAPVTVDRMRYLATLETEEKARYSEFSKAADNEGFRKIANLFKDIMAEEENHNDEMGGTKTLMNLRTAIKREKDKTEVIKKMITDSEASDDDENTERLSRMLVEEELHIKKLEEALKEVDTEIKKNYKSSEEYYCTYGVCVPKIKDGGE
ncbi:MAG: rubrerythrin family protein [Candidatus Aenigmarchaeota archaeon]|nr:rubrerythrin family protein [Candidatus Aenigmarchaeota archaeon]